MSTHKKSEPDGQRTQLGLFGPEDELAAPSPEKKRGVLPKKDSGESESRTNAMSQALMLPDGATLHEIAIESVVRGTFSYYAEKNLSAQMVPGARVMVPFGRRSVPGYVLGPSSRDDLEQSGFDISRLKGIQKRIDLFERRGQEGAQEPLLTDELIGLARWMSRRYACSVGAVLGAMLPAGVKSGSMAARLRMAALRVPAARAMEEAEKIRRRAPKQAALIEELIAANVALPVPDLLARAGAGDSALKGLEKKGILDLVEKASESIAEIFGQSGSGESQQALPVTMTGAQNEAVAALSQAIQSGAYKGFLLQGVTGSGKTEVYLRVLEEILDSGKQGIVLVPEIALTPQTAERFERRLGSERVEVLHSHLTGGERAEAWRKIRAGTIDVVVGARSALFAPLARLGCIIIDEEHEGAFKQDTAPRYHARTVACERARMNSALLVLGSATPSLESSQAARTAALTQLVLPERVAGRSLPDVIAVDMRSENQETKKYNYLSRALRKAIRETLDEKDQSILFLNRRGFATVITCVRCGHTEKCSQCDITLTNHKEKDALTCHYCGLIKPVPEHCSACGAPGVKFWGLGTERVENEVRRLFPTARVARMDSDTMSRREAYLDTLSAFRKGEIDILIGTQMIAKGLDFPNVTLVGIVLADTSLHMPDFRSRERTFQLVEQVSGRAGRGEKGGRVIVQTYLPNDPALKYATKHDFAGFLMEELGVRKSFGYPPFTHLARILVRSKDVVKGREAAQYASNTIRETSGGNGLKILGPSPAPIARLEGWYRFHVLIKADEPEQLDELFSGPLWDGLKKLKGAEAQVDVEPMAML